MDQLRKLLSVVILALIIGWVLYIGKNIFIPVAFGAVVVYIIAGLSNSLDKIPYSGRFLPNGIRQALSALAIAFALLMLIHGIMSYKDSAIALAPQYQQSLLTAIQRIAVFFRIETEPTWTTLRQDLLVQINIQTLVGTMVASASSLIVSVIVVLLYAVFLLLEQRSFATKIANISTDPQNVAHIQKFITDINRRIGSYLALKTLINIFLGFVCWAIMAFAGLEFAVLLAVLAGFLNYIPYVGTFLGIVVPAIMAIAQFNDPGMVITLLIALTLAQFIIGNFLDPYIMSNSLNLSPFAILFSLAVWSELWGIPGAFLAVPITAIIAIAASEFSYTRPIAIFLSKNGRP
jgi:predicted PurR-regulated permease PerM